MGDVAWKATLAVLGIRTRWSAVDSGFEIGGRGGAVLRAVRFGERTAIVGRAAGEDSLPEMVDSVATGILAAALIRPGDGDRIILEVAALALAGAHQPAPSFEEIELLLGAAGWTPDRIIETAAADADHLGAAPDRSDDGWTHLVFAEAGPDERDLERVRTTWAGHLLERHAPSHRSALSRWSRSEPPQRADGDVSPATPHLGDEPRGGSTLRGFHERAAEATAGVAASDGPVAPPTGTPRSEVSPGEPAFAFRLRFRQANAVAEEPRATVRGARAGEESGVIGTARRASPAPFPVNGWRQSTEPIVGDPAPDMADGRARTRHIAPRLAEADLRQTVRTAKRPAAAHAAGSEGTGTGWDALAPERAAWSTAWDLPAPAPAGRTPRALDPEGLADEIAMLLDEEADLRGIDT